MKILLCTVLFTFVIFFHSVHSVKQSGGPNQRPSRHVLKYNRSTNAWFLHGKLYGKPLGGGIAQCCNFDPQRIPYPRQRRRQVKYENPPPRLFTKEDRMLPPDLEEGDIMYRHGVPFAKVIIVQEFKLIWKLNHPQPGQLGYLDHHYLIGVEAPPGSVGEPQEGDTLVLSGQWTHNPYYGCVNRRYTCSSSGSCSYSG